MTLERFNCPYGRKEESVRWDVCIFRHLEAQKSKKRSPCKKCTKPGQFVKMLVNEVL